MDIRKLQRAIVDGLEDVKAQNILVFNTEHLSPLFERVIVASGTSNRQTKALAASVRDAVQVGRRAGAAHRGRGRTANGSSSTAARPSSHVMQPAIRDYYHLEEIWGDKPVKMKIDVAPPPRLVKAAPAGAASSAARVARGAASRAAAPPSGRRRRRAPRPPSATAVGRGTPPAKRRRSHRAAAKSGAVEDDAARRREPPRRRRGPRPKR